MKLKQKNGFWIGLALLIAGASALGVALVASVEPHDRLIWGEFRMITMERYLVWNPQVWHVIAMILSSAVLITGVILMVTQIRKN